MKHQRAKWLLPLGFGVFLVAFWYALRPITGFSRFALPVPHEVLADLADQWRTLLAAAGRTLLGAAMGLGAALALGLGAAMLMAWQRPLRVMLYPWVLVLQMLPLVILVPLIVLWMDGFSAIVVITFLISFFPIVANTVQGLLAVDLRALEYFRMQGASRWQTLLHLRIPSALPYLLTGAQISVTLAIIGAVTGEMFAGTTRGGNGGLGYLVIIYRSQGETAGMMSAGLVACLLGFFFVGSVQLVRRRLLGRWYGEG